MTKKIVSLLLVCLLAFSSIPLLFGNYASAATGAANFLPNAYYDDPAQGGFDTQNEVQRSQNATQYITTLLSNRYGSSNCYTKTDASCTKSAYQSTLNTLKSYDKAVIYSKGHRTVVPVANPNQPGMYYNHPGIIPSYTTPYPDYDSYLLDYEIYACSSSKNIVTFIWHCQTAMNYNGNGVIPSLGGYVYGLPFCFTHNPSMGYYGSSGSQVYLGWVDRNDFWIQWPNGTAPTYRPTVGSPNYEWKMTANNDFGRVAELYWYYMSQGTYTSYSALNKISTDIYGTGFMTGDLYNWLVIYGNQAMVLPY